MKDKFTVGLLLICLTTQITLNVGIGMYYAINKDYIAKKLCEKRNVAGSTCEGHCYLSKQLKKAEEGAQKSVPYLKISEELVCILYQNLPPLGSDSNLIADIFVSLKSIWLAGYLPDLVHPPTG